ncbi:MAG TPA: DUF2911 domain-containing protein [Sphingobacteriaceae bacterium]
MKLLKLIPCALLIAAGLQGSAQGLKMPQASSSQTLTQEFGLGGIKIQYSRPNMKGRKIFGDLVPWDQVWRTGANSATTITFTDDVRLEGNAVPAGQYGLFTIPGKTEWTIILNKKAQQWGAYEYDQAQDFLRFTVKPVTGGKKTESFSISITDVMPTSAVLHLSWDTYDVPVRMTTEVDSKVMANIEAAMKGDNKPYFQAAQYYYDNGKDISKALEWVNQAESADQKAPWIKYLKARIQLKAGDKKGAAATAEEGVKIARESNNEEYVRLNAAILAQARK